MSSSITITFEPGTIGFPREQWETWADDHGLEPSAGSGGVLYYGGAGMARVEAGYHEDEGLRITFSTFHLGAGMPMVADLALQLWAVAGGALHASPELAKLIALRVAGAASLLQIAATLNEAAGMS